MFQTRNMSLEVRLKIGNVFFSNQKKNIENVLGTPHNVYLMMIHYFDLFLSFALLIDKLIGLSVFRFWYAMSHCATICDIILLE